MLKGFCQKRYHSMNINNQESPLIINQQTGLKYTNVEEHGAPQARQNVALESVSTILSKLVSQAEARFIGSINSLGNCDAGALNAAQLLKVQMDVTLNNTTTSMSSSILAAIGSMLRSISNNIHA